MQKQLDHRRTRTCNLLVPLAIEAKRATIAPGSLDSLSPHSSLQLSTGTLKRWVSTLVGCFSYNHSLARCANKANKAGNGNRTVRFEAPLGRGPPIGIA